MFGNGKRQQRRLLSEGQQAEAEILEANETLHTVDDAEGKHFVVWDLRLRVQPADAVAFDAKAEAPFRPDSPPAVGATLAVRYDVRHHSKVVVDLGDAAPVRGEITPEMRASLRSLMFNPEARAELLREQGVDQVPGSDN